MLSEPPVCPSGDGLKSAASRGLPEGVDRAGVGHVHDEPHGGAGQPVRCTQLLEHPSQALCPTHFDEPLAELEDANLSRVRMLDYAIAASPVSERGIGIAAGGCQLG